MYIAFLSPPYTCSGSELSVPLLSSRWDYTLWSG